MKEILMKFAANYSPALAELVQAGEVQLDVFKCPAWPDLLAEAARTLPVYIHYPLGIGSGLGYPLDHETHQPADLERIAALREQTGTLLINTHFIAPAGDYPGVALDSRSPADIQRVLDGALRDLEPLIARFGAENVVVENVIPEHGWLEISVLPEALAGLLERSGCGFLLDLSHARLTAHILGLEARAYTAALPVDYLCEAHVTGIQLMQGALFERLLAADEPGGLVSQYAGKWLDHLPMTDADWPELAWLLGEIRAGQDGVNRWAAPWVVANEVGGVGRFWQVVSDHATYRDQLPRMQRMVVDASES